jgi:hypothetical protein
MIYVLVECFYADDACHTKSATEGNCNVYHNKESECESADNGINSGVYL